MAYIRYMFRYWGLKLILIFSFSLESQNIAFKGKHFKDKKKELKLISNEIKAGNSAIKGKSYFTALDHFFRAQDFNPHNALNNYKIGYCLFHMVGTELDISWDSNHKQANVLQSLQYLEKAKELDSLIDKKIHSLFYLELSYQNSIEYLMGRCYHLDMEWEKAINLYEISKRGVLKNKELSLNINIAKALKETEKKINECEYGLSVKGRVKNVLVTKLGDNINTEYSEYCPLISADESELFFTSSRPKEIKSHKVIKSYSNGYIKVDSKERNKNINTEKKYKSRQGIEDNDYDEDIYQSFYEQVNWGKAQQVGPPINTESHDATVGLSFDAQTLFLYQIDEKNGGDLYESFLEGNKWSYPRPLSKKINSKDQETSACFSPDERTLFFTSSKSDGFGGKDIYYCKKMFDGSWGRSVNIGSAINSRYDEDGVYMHPDGKTLYFSSKGHQTLGGYDIFKSIYKDGEWTSPKNLGYPINTPGDDVFFTLSADGKTGYFSSVRKNGKGKHDIYMVEFPENYHLYESNILHNDLVLLKGRILDPISNQPLEAEIIIIDNIADKIIAQFKSNAKTGKYLVALPSGKNYGIVIKKDSMLFHTENIQLEKGKFKVVNKKIKLQKIKVGSRLVLKNIFYEFGTTNLLPESSAELKRLVAFLKRFSKIKFEIAGHTDNVGDQIANQVLSEQRAKTIYEFLIDHNIERTRVNYKGYGSKKPIAENNTAEGRQKNRRTEFRIISQ